MTLMDKWKAYRQRKSIEKEKNRFPESYCGRRERDTTHDEGEMTVPDYIRRIEDWNNSHCPQYICANCNGPVHTRSNGTCIHCGGPVVLLQRDPTEKLQSYRSKWTSSPKGVVATIKSRTRGEIW